MGRSEERDVRDELERLWMIVEQLPDGVLLTTLEGVIARVSGGTGFVPAVDADQLQGRKILELVTSEERGRLFEGLKKAGRTGSYQGTFSAVGGGVRGCWLELHLLLLEGRGFLVVARDVTCPRLRERNLRILVDGMQNLAAEESILKVRNALWVSISRLLPEATYLWLYEGEGDRVQMVWSSREDAPPWSFNVRGWGSKIAGLLGESESGQEFLKWFGASEADAREKLERLVSGRGGPLLLNHPEEQLRIYLGERELGEILQLWGDQAPGQLIHCPIISEGELEMLAVIDAAPGERPFTDEDADWAWQLVSMAHQVEARIEAADRASAQLDEVRIVRDAVHHVGGTQGVGELMNHLCRAAVDGLQADRLAVFGKSTLGVDEVQWSHGFSEDLEVLVHRHVPELPMDSSGRPEAVYLADASRDEAWRLLGGETTVSVVAIPLIALGDRVGLIAAFWDREQELDDSMRTLVEFFAGELSLILSYRTVLERNENQRSVAEGVMDAVAEGVVLTDLDGRVEDVGDGTEDLLGMEDGWKLGSSILDMAWGEAKAKIALLMQQAIERRFGSIEVTAPGGGPLEVTTRPAGREMLLWLFSEPVDGISSPTPSALEALPIGVIELDRQGHVIEMNPAARNTVEAGDVEATITGIEPEEFETVGRGGVVDVHLQRGLAGKLLRSESDPEKFFLVLHAESSLEEVRRLHSLLARVEPTMARLNDRATALITQLAVCREEVAESELGSRLERTQQLAEEIRRQVRAMAETADRALRGEWAD